MRGRQPRDPGGTAAANPKAGAAHRAQAGVRQGRRRSDERHTADGTASAGDGQRDASPAPDARQPRANASRAAAPPPALRPCPAVRVAPLARVRGKSAPAGTLARPPRAASRSARTLAHPWLATSDPLVDRVVAGRPRRGRPIDQPTRPPANRPQHTAPLGIHPPLPSVRPRSLLPPTIHPSAASHGCPALQCVSSPPPPRP